MAFQDFIDQLKELGYTPEIKEGNRVCFEYDIPVGKFIGQVISLGFIVPSDFPASPPSGPHMLQHLRENNPSSNVHPDGGIHNNDQFAQGWQYWSRPFPNWARTNRSVKIYMAHIRHLFETQ